MHDSTTTVTTGTTSLSTARRRRILTIGAAALLSVGVFGAAADAAGGGKRSHQRASVMEQGGGDVYQHNGARLIRTDHSVEVKWRVQTPTPGSYTYPAPGPGHPPIEPGFPEVFTLWAFAFDHPELCSDGVCNGDDVGDTPARGSVYQLDGEIVEGHRVKMSGKIRLGQTPLDGLGLSNPLGVELHVAMAPHGAATEGDGLITQLNTGGGGPPFWWTAFFLPA